MAKRSPDSYSTSPPIKNNKYDEFLFQNNAKIIQRKPIFAPILEEPGDIHNNLQNLNTSSIPMGNNNNNSSFENSMNGIHLIDYHTMNKFRPSLNLSGLPPVFEIPKHQIQNKNNINSMLNITNNQSINNSIYNDNNLNIKLMRGSRLNLKPIMNNSNMNQFNNTAGGNNNLNNNKSNFISLPPINNNTNYNKLKDIKNDNQNNYKYNNNINYINNTKNNNALNIRNYQNRKKQYLKPIQMQKSLPYKNNIGSYNNIHEVRRTLDENRDINNKNNLNLNKNGNQGKYYYNLNNKNIIKNEKLKEERALRNKEMSNISLSQNKNYVDRNIVILNNKDSKINNNKTNINIYNNIYNSNIDEFISINKNKTRVIHITNLKIYDKFDIPGKKYIFFENYIKNWIKMMHGTIQIKNIIENNNINYYHIIIERTKNGSLGNLMRTIGSLNEYIIMFISKQLIPLIKLYNSNFDYRFTELNEQLYNYIDIDNIWFNSQYNILIYPGKLNKFHKNTKNINEFLTKLYNLNNNQNNKIIKDINDETLKIQLNIDLMNYGITLININIFILNITVNDLFELINKNENTDNKKECCLFHYFYNNIKIFSNFYDSLKQNNELSENYFDFLHILTSFNITDNNYEKISNHPFINNSLIINEYSNINELIKIGKIYDFSNEYYTSNSNIISYDLICNNIKKKLGNFLNYYEYYNIYDIKTLFNVNDIEFEELCKELRVNNEELHDKLLVNYENLFENKE